MSELWCLIKITVHHRFLISRKSFIVSYWLITTVRTLCKRRSAPLARTEGREGRGLGNTHIKVTVDQIQTKVGDVDPADTCVLQFTKLRRVVSGWMLLINLHERSYELLTTSPYLRPALKLVVDISGHFWEGLAVVSQWLTGRCLLEEWTALTELPFAENSAVWTLQIQKTQVSASGMLEIHFDNINYTITKLLQEVPLCTVHYGLLQPV